MLWLSSILILSLHQDLIGWSVFEDATFRWEYREEVGAQVEMPVMGQKLNSLDGTEIELAGFYLPMDMERKHIIISKQPYASCFFCGGDAGQESVAEIRFVQKPPRFTVDEIVHVKGRLRINPDDFDHLVFILEEAVLAE